MSRYVLSYLGVNDPPKKEERELVSSLGNAQVLDRMPGTLLVDGSKVELAKVAKKFSGWSLSPVAQASVGPPRKRIVNIA
ncbi:hypothetical protein ACFPOU_23200 [Massilia jejuensis]|uniref:Uncharacterized protein n=1 Tax=Massilia jejuensis TaxID=648894 RepID=A0ABW0PUH6_9BURK